MSVRQFILTSDPALFWAVVAIACAFAMLAFLQALRSLQRSHMIDNTPTSRIRSASQGYVELEGRCALLPGPPIVAPLTGTHCVWYRVEVQERSEGSRGRSEWRVVRAETSDDLFALRDNSGECIVNPDGAEVTPTTSATWYGDSAGWSPPPAAGGSALFSTGRYRFTEQRLHPGPLYVLGYFSTVGGSQEVPDTPEEVRSLLSSWKRDYPGLLRRFDTNGDGRLDPEEWETVRQAASKEVRRQQRERFTTATANLIARPGDGRPFVISAIAQEALARRLGRHAAAYAAAFLLGTALVAWSVLLRLS